MEGLDPTLFDPITAEIITRAQKGEESALEMIYRRYRLDIYRYLYYRVGQLDVAEDLTSGVFKRMIQAIKGAKFTNTSFEAWLFQIARNKAIDYFRQTGVHDHLSVDEELVLKGETTGGTGGSDLSSDQMVQALKDVREAQRDVIILRFAVGMPIAQVAQTLNRNEDTVKGLQRSGLTTIRNILSDWEGNNA